MKDLKVVFFLGGYKIFKDNEEVKIEELNDADIMVLALLGMSSETVYHNDLKHLVESKHPEIKEKMSNENMEGTGE